jgi:hypothetical protein
MKAEEVARIRLSNQMIAAPVADEAKGLMERLVAVQAQDYEMAKWALGLRLPSPRRSLVEAAISHGEILRTHLLRPTWHFVSARDIRWLLDLTGPRIKASLVARHRQLGITGKVLSTSLRAIEQALPGGRQLGRGALIAALQEAGVATGDSRASHFFLYAELEALICSGDDLGRETSYALLDDRVPPGATRNRSEALAELAQRYFTSRGPASLEDFAWWSGLAMGEARGALAEISAGLEEIQTEGSSLWLAPSDSAPPSPRTTLRLLPAFDEYLISYTDRSAAITDMDNRKAVSNNGIFRPTIVRGGKVVGTWARRKQKSELIVETLLFRDAGRSLIRAIEKEAEAYLQFWRT